MQLPVVSHIAAMGKNRELGAGNALLWHLPDDFAWFVKHTRGHPVIMGRKTMESLGRPLKNRQNIVISRNPELKMEGFEIVPDIHTAFNLARLSDTDEIFIIGGGEIYRQSLPFTHRLYLTLVHAAFPAADTFYPSLDPVWKETFREHHTSDDKHAFAFDFCIYER
ncbi:MAG: dihydrofolate reductase [Bacteroidetes bacterium]|nr:dihydrofolate reductase [Bacteroidota bacterium]